LHESFSHHLLYTLWVKNELDLSSGLLYRSVYPSGKAPAQEVCVDVAFRTRKLQRRYQRSADATRAYGDEVGGKYIARINLMKQPRDIEEVSKHYDD